MIAKPRKNPSLSPTPRCAWPDHGITVWDIRKKLFTLRVSGPWNRLHREVVTTPSLTEFKKYLDDACRHMVSFLGCPLQGQDLILIGPFQLSIFYDFMNPQNKTSVLNPKETLQKHAEHSEAYPHYSSHLHTTISLLIHLNQCEK